MSTEGKTDENQGEGNKVQKTFDANMSKLVALLGGEKNLKPTGKVAQDAVAKVVEELLKDKQDAAVKSIKEGIANLIETHIKLKKELIAKRKELDKLEQDKMTEFNKVAKDIFDKIDGIGELEKQYYDSLRAAGGQSTETKTE